MFKVGLTALITAIACFAIAAATGLGAAVLKPLTLARQAGGRLQARKPPLPGPDSTQVVCGADALENSVQVYFQPHLLAVIKFNKTGTKFTQLYAAKR